MSSADNLELDDLKGLRADLRSREFTSFASLSVADPRVASLLGSSGCDVVFIDAEHSPFTLPQISACLDAIAPTPASTVVRVAANDAAEIKQVLDLGPDGIVVPMIGNSEEALGAVRACRYPPEGIRGFGVARAQGYGLSAQSYFETANSSVATIAIVESAEGVTNAGQIAAVEGLDGIFVGPHDLAADMGVGLGDPSVEEAVTTIVGAANEAGISAGSMCSPDEVPAKLDAGMRLLLVFVDFLGLSAAAQETYDQVNTERQRRESRVER